MVNSRAIVLIGMPVSGKSTLGLLVARELGFAFVDLDRRVEACEGMSIPEIFARHGVEAFRRSEERELAAVIALPRVVVATGGGVVEIPGISELLQGHRIIHLHCEREEALQRLLAGPRPLQSGHGEQHAQDLRDAQVAQYDALSRRRSALYHELGGTPVITSGTTVEAALEACLTLLRK